jgi:hypothetical protein
VPAQVLRNWQNQDRYDRQGCPRIAEKWLLSAISGTEQLSAISVPLSARPLEGGRISQAQTTPTACSG